MPCLNPPDTQVVGESSDPTQSVVETQQQQAQIRLLDLELGGRSGFQVLHELKRRESSRRASGKSSPGWSMA